jgi:hypothetical protein
MGAVQAQQKLSLKQCRPRHVWQRSADRGIPSTHRTNSDDVPIDTPTANSISLEERPKWRLSIKNFDTEDEKFSKMARQTGC